MWTVSNIISLSRLFLSIPVAYVLWKEDLVGFCILALFALASDFLDGYYARKRNEISDMGKILDPLADKVIVGVTVLMMIIIDKMPLWLGIAIFTRDILIFLGGIYARSKLGIVMASNMTGKITVNIISVEILLLIFNVHWAYTWGAYVTLVFLIYSFINYFVIFISRIQKKKTYST